MRIARGTKKTAPRQGCKLSVTTTATNNHEHLAPLTGCGCDATAFYTPATPDGAAGNPTSRLPRDKSVCEKLATSVKHHGAKPVAALTPFRHSGSCQREASTTGQRGIIILPEGGTTNAD